MIRALLGGSNVKGLILGHNRGQTVRDRADPADSLGNMLSVLWIPPYQYLFKTTEQGPGGPGIDDLLFTFDCIHSHFYLKMSFKTSYGINDFYCGHQISSLFN